MSKLARKILFRYITIFCLEHLYDHYGNYSVNAIKAAVKELEDKDYIKKAYGYPHYYTLTYKGAFRKAWIM